MHEPYFPPWGTVTPTYWTVDDGRRGPAPAAPQRALATEESEKRVQKASAASSTDMPDGAPTQTSATDEVEPPPPEAFRDRITAVTAAFSNPADREGLAAAGIEAEKLDQELTAQYGEQHTYTISIREIRGWLAHLTGQPGVAALWYLHTTGLQIALHGQDHALAEASVRRAVGTWQQVTDPKDAVQIGNDLARVVSAVLGPDSDVALFVQDRVNRYQQQ